MNKYRKTSLTEEEKQRIKDKFQTYKNVDSTLKEIGNELGLEQSTIGKYFKKFFGDDYSKISKIKSHKHNTKVSHNKLSSLFIKYKNGESLEKLALEAKINLSALRARMRRAFGKEYGGICKKRFSEFLSRTKSKVSKEKIKIAFEKYKNSYISLTKLGNELGLAESSLIFRFKREFREKYRKLALSRRDERKVTKRDYIKAFEEYENSDVSLTDLARKLNIKISSLRSRFLNLFGGRYIKIATKKQESLVLNKKGNDAEFLAREYLKILGIYAKDVRERAILKGTLKRPDFIVKDTFIEVKSYFVDISNKRLKGYNDIISDYLGKETKEGITLKKGMIISIGGFSDKVKLKAKEDGIKIIDYIGLIEEFKSRNRYDLMDKLENLIGQRFL